MRYPPQHKEEVIQHIVRNAGAAAKKDGFGTSGIDTLTKAAGLTSGSFYKHFAGKSELLTAIIAHEFDRSLQYFFPQRPDKDRANASGHTLLALQRMTRIYLSAEHVDHPEKGCLIPSLSAEIARADNQTRATYEAGLKRMHAAMSAARAAGRNASKDANQDANQDAGNHSNKDADQTWAMLAMMVGAVSMARAASDPELKQTILEACLKQMEYIGQRADKPQ